MSALYEVTISHARSAPLRNVFRYRSYLWLVDLDHLPRVPLLTVFRGRDHLGDPRRGIRENLDRFLAANGISRPHTITMLTQARVLGYVFNPLTVYWCHRPDGTLACVVAEVHNTYRQRHAYLLPGARAEVLDAPIVRAVPGTRADLVVGEYVFVTAQAAQDGTLRAPRIQVSKDGVKPPQ